MCVWCSNTTRKENGVSFISPPSIGPKADRFSSLLVCVSSAVFPNGKQLTTTFKPDIKAEVEAEYLAERLKRKIHKKGPAPKLLGNERCQVCGQQANGFHYCKLRNPAHHYDTRRH